MRHPNNIESRRDHSGSSAGIPRKDGLTNSRTSSAFSTLILIALSGLLEGLPFGWQNITPQEGIVLPNTMATALELFPLKTGSTVIVQRPIHPDIVDATYFFFSSKLTGSVSQGVVFDPIPGNYGSMLLTEAKYLYVGSWMTNSDAKIHKLAYDPTSNQYISISVNPVLNLKAIRNFADDVANSGNSFWLNSQTRQLFRYSMLTGFFATAATILHSEASDMQAYAATVLVYGSSNSTIQFVMQSTMAVVKSLTGNFISDTYLVDVSNSSLLYSLAVNLAANQERSLIVIDLSKLGEYQILQSMKTYEQTRGLAINFDIHNLLVLLENDLTLRLLQKSTLTALGSNLWVPITLNSMMFRTFTQGVSQGLKFVFHYALQLSPAIYHSYYMQLDYCQRDSEGKCTECLEGYLKVPSSDDCFPAATGIDLATGKLASCLVAGCLECFQDITKCTKCSGVRPKQYLYNNVCVPSIIEGMGPSGSYLVKCLPQNCLDCSLDHSLCRICDVSKGYFYLNGTCIDDSQMLLQGLGRDSSEKEAKPCFSSQCADCVSDYRKCKICDITNGFRLDPETTTCRDSFENELETRIQTTFLALTKQIRLDFLGPLHATNNYTNAFKITFGDQADFRDGLSCETEDAVVSVRLSKVEATSLTFDILSSKHIFEGSFTFEVYSNHTLLTEASHALAGFPVTLSPVTIYEEGYFGLPEIQWAVGTISVLPYLHIPVLVGHQFILGPVSLFPGHTLSLILALGMADSPWLNRTDGVFRKVAPTVLSQPWFGLHSLGRGTQECKPTSRQYKLSLECSFLLNACGMLASIAIIGIVALAAGLIDRLATRNRNVIRLDQEGTNRNKGCLSDSKWPHILAEFLNASFFFRETESWLLGLLLLVGVNLTHNLSGFEVIVGLFIAMCVLCYYTAHSVLLFEAARSVTEQIDPSEAVYPPKTVAEVVDWNRVEFRAVAIQFGPLIASSDPKRYLGAVYATIRALAFTVTIVMNPANNAIQMATLVGVQVVYLGSYMGFCSTKSAWHKWLTIWIESLFLCCLVFKLVAVHSVDDIEVLQKIDELLPLLLLTLAASTPLANFVLIAQSIFKWISQRRKAKILPVSEPSSETERGQVLSAVNQAGVIPAISSVQRAKGPQVSLQMPSSARVESNEVLPVVARVVRVRPRVIQDAKPSEAEPANAAQSKSDLAEDLKKLPLLKTLTKKVGKQSTLAPAQTAAPDGNIIPSSSLVSPDIPKPAPLEARAEPGSATPAQDRDLLVVKETAAEQVPDSLLKSS